MLSPGGPIGPCSPCGPLPGAGSCPAWKSFASSEPSFTLAEVTALLLSLPPVTAPFFSCFVPTLLAGRLTAAYAPPPERDKQRD